MTKDEATPDFQAMTKDEVIELLRYELWEGQRGLCPHDEGKRLERQYQIYLAAKEYLPEKEGPRPAIQLSPEKYRYAGTKDAYENATGYGIKWGSEE